MSTKASKPVPTFFTRPEDFRRWLARYHSTMDVLWVGYYKKSSGKPSIDWPQSRDEALCFGWIDGIRKSLTQDSYTIRFTPRRSGSIWSAVNIARVRALTTQGRMTEAGLAVFGSRDPAKSQRSSFERATVSFPPHHLRTFKKHTKAWRFFEEQPPSYRRMAMWWVLEAKKEETQDRRLATLIRDSDAGLRIQQLRRGTDSVISAKRTGANE